MTEDRRRSAIRVQYFQGNEKYFLALILLVAGYSTGIVLFLVDSHSFVYFGDAASHIVRARQFIDSQMPGVNNIGTVWLPLPHLLLIPLVAIDDLFYTGIAGAILGIPFLACTGVLLFSILRALTGSSRIAFFAALLFGLNPNVVYMALTPMTEMSLLFFVTLGGFALLRWFQMRGERWLLLCAAAVVLATLCRYEAWLLAPFISLIAIANGVSSWRRKEKNSAIRMVAMSMFCWTGIAFWIGWNYYAYADAFKFAHWTFSVGTIAVRTAFHHRPQDVFIILGKALSIIFGPAVLLASVYALCHVRRMYKNKKTMLLLVFFSLPAFFVLTAILVGFVQIDQWWWNWRYVLTFGLVLSVAGAFGLSIFFSKVQSTLLRSAVVLFFAATPVIQLAMPRVGVATFNDAKKSFDEKTRSAIESGELIHSRYESGSIGLLTAYGLGQRIMISSRLPLRTFTVIYTSPKQPVRFSDRYIIVGKDRMLESKGFTDFWTSNKEEVLQQYCIRSETKHFILIERITVGGIQ